MVTGGNAIAPGPAPSGISPSPTAASTVCSSPSTLSSSKANTTNLYMITLSPTSAFVSRLDSDPLDPTASVPAPTSTHHHPAAPCLPGFEDIIYCSEPSPAINDYYAIRPDPSALELIGQRFAELCGRRGSYDSPIKLENLHISLHGFGSHLGCSKFLCASAMTAAASVVTAPFAVTFDYSMSFDAKRFKRPFVLRGHHGLTELKSFQQSLGRAMKSRGLRRFVAGHFTPHITLLYSPQKRDEHRMDPIVWTVKDFVLLRSFVGHSRQIELGRWPLRG